MDLEVEEAADEEMQTINNYDPDDESNDDDDKDSEDEDGERAAFDPHKAQRIFAELVCSCEVTISNVLELLKHLNPDAQMDHDTIKANCLNIYEEERVKVKEFFRNMDGQLSISVDVLRNFLFGGKIGEFMCLSAHFIDDSWKSRKWVLRFKHLSGLEDYFVSDAILKTLKDWEIEDKVSTFVASTLFEDDIDEGIEIFRGQIQTVKKLQLDGQLLRVKCCAAMFNKMAKTAFKEISVIIDKVRQLSWCKSPPLWHLTTDKLKTALELEAIGEFSPDKIGDFYDIPSPEEWKKVEVVYNLTEKAYNIAKMLFDTKYPTANLYLSNLQELREYLVQESISSCSFTCKVAKKMLAKLETYWKNAFLFMGISSFLDPRYKMKYIEYLSSKHEGSDGDSEVTRILDAIHNLYDGYLTNDAESEYPMDDSDSSNLDDEELEERAELLRNEEQESIRSWVEEYIQFTKINDKPPKSDLEWYLEEPVVTWSPDFNVLKWWRAKAPKYPTLAKMARDILAIQMSVVTSDGAYSTQPREAKLFRLGPGGDLQNALMCTRTWLFKKNVDNDDHYHIPALSDHYFF